MLIKSEDITKVREIKEFLTKHYKERHDYDYLVRKFGMNKFKLKIAFKAVTNYNVHSFINKLRVEHAKELLETTDQTIEAIATRVGLAKSNLNIQFKKITGKTPSQWRKKPKSDFKLYFLNSEE